MPTLAERFADWATNGRYGQAIAIQKEAVDLMKRIDEAAGGGGKISEASAITLSGKFSLFASALDYRTTTALSAIYTAVQSHRSEVIKAVETVKPFYLAVAIVDQIAEDSLTPDVSTGEVVAVKSKKREVQKQIEILEERIGGFDKLVNDIVADLLYQGEYTLRPVVDGPAAQQADQERERGKSTGTSEEPPTSADQKLAGMVAEPAKPRGGGAGKPSKNNSKGRGVVSLHDDVDQARVVAITESGDITGFLTISDQGRSTTTGSTAAAYERKVQWVPPHSYIKFTLGRAKMRVKLVDDPMLKEMLQNNEEFKKKVPMYVRVGRSVLFPVLSKIKELQLMEQLVPATKLQALTSGTLVGMKVPGGFDIVKGFDAAREAENLVNKKIGIDTFNSQINVENILSTVGRIKIIPQFGDQGVLQRYDYKPTEPQELLSNVTDLRRVILSSVGMPFELLFGSDRAERKGEFLKRYARYLRRLKSVQQGIADGLRQLVEIHLVNTGTDFVPSEDIQVEFRNKLIQIDLLDELEFLDTTVGMLGNVLKFFGVDLNLMSKVSNFKELLKFLKSELRVLGLDNVIDETKAGALEAAQNKQDDVESESPAASGKGPVARKDEKPGLPKSELDEPPPADKDKGKNKDKGDKPPKGKL